MPSILLALAIGTLSYAVRRLGVSLVLYLYLYSIHSNWFGGSQAHGGIDATKATIAGGVIGLGVILITFRSAFNHYAKQCDARAMPAIDQRALIHLNREDLSITQLRTKSRAILETAKALLVLLLLAVLCLFGAVPLSIILLTVMSLTVLLSVAVGRQPEKGDDAGWFSRFVSHPDTYVEIMLVAGLIIGFLLISAKGGLVSGTLLVLMIARFGGALRTIASNTIHLIRWHSKDTATWARRAAQAAALELRAAKKAAFLADRQARQEAQKLARQLAKSASKLSSKQASKPSPSTGT